jgi:cell division GTPase FtsZ
MATQSKIETLNQEEIVNDIEKPQVDEDKLAALKARAAQKRAEEESKNKENFVPPRIVEERQRSIRFGIIGSGQGGSRLSEQFFALGYPAVVINTAPQDLENIKIPEQQKLLLDFGLGGSAKDLSIGHDAADAYRDAINQLIQRHLSDVQMFIFCTSLGGGSGAGSVEVVVDILAQLGKPVVVLTVLPKASEDAQLKHNAWQTLSKLTKLFSDGKISNIITVDNAKIESLYSDVGPFNFFAVSNKEIV